MVSKKVAKSSAGKKQPLSKDALEIVAARFRAMGDATRLELLQYLMDKEHSVQELCDLTGMSQANISKHLSLLADQGILNRRKQGLFVYYSVADMTIFQLCDLVCGSLSERFAKVQQHFAQGS
ncbi:MAG: metalloregulator ArsR/SmtB family transcription factor [Candidatus Obscuribacterales bacterium]|nr:winged helix-turn-helix transcriptional regulator [Cyanobacteria bacterium SZAS LIN-5]RTL46120.1 MAG: ArsR family transcriptional regulator [Candidatus Melainabacteria bacterium]